jgi:hypothetical protein
LEKIFAENQAANLTVTDAQLKGLLAGYCKGDAKEVTQTGRRSFNE